MPTTRRFATRRRSVRVARARRRSGRFLSSALINIGAGDMDAFELGPGNTDVQGATHLLTWGLVSVFPNTLPPAGTQLLRWAMGCRVDTDAIAVLPSADLTPLRDFTAQAVAYQDKAWRGRQYRHGLYLSTDANPIWPAGASFSPSNAYSARKLGTTDQGESWYLYLVNNSSIDLDFVIDLQTAYLLP